MSLSLRSDSDQAVIVSILTEAEALDEKAQGELRAAMAESPDDPPEILLAANQWASEEAITSAHSAHLGVGSYAFEDPAIVEETPTEEAPQTLRVIWKDVGGETVETVSFGQFLERVSTLSQRVSETFCRDSWCFPLETEDAKVELVCLNPSEFTACEEAAMRLGRMVRPLVCTETLLRTVLKHCFGERDMVREISDESHDSSDEVAGEETDADGGLLLDLAQPVAKGEEGQVIRLVNLLLRGAVEQDASDIHIESYEGSQRVRYRVDGSLVEVSSPPRALFIPSLSRLKILSKMDIAEKRVPQDGAIAMKLGDDRIDLRVSTVPTVYGEKMVIRLLKKGGIPKRLEDLGFTEKQAKDFMGAAHSPHGLMFVTGPTGSGKSTTLYCCLTQINVPEDNIATVEDPVEYKFTGLNQVQVHHAVGLDFSRALRAFLRQDPDVIMVGEVRDQETAQIVQRAAMTGHLVLSTLHTNSALQVINRLCDMGIEPFLLGPALRMVQAQRLLRRLCSNCRVERDLPDDLARRHGLEPGTRGFSGGQDPRCSQCGGKGYKGRLGIYEVIPISEALQEAIVKGETITALETLARSEGVQFLSDAARDRMREGLTSFEEVAEFIRVRD